MFNRIRNNSFIKILTFSDVIVLSGWGLVNPLFAVFVTKQIKGGTVELVGLATCLYFDSQNGPMSIGQKATKNQNSPTLRRSTASACCAVVYSIALSGALSGFMVNRFGFRILYFIVGIVCTFGSSFLLLVYKELRQEEKSFFFQK